MYSSLLLFITASASAAAIEPRQVDGQVYCGGGKSGFNPDDCRAAAERIPTDRTHEVAAEVWYGNCRLDAHLQFGSVGEIDGQLYRDSVNSILDSCADGAGYVYHGGVRVQVDLCEICGSGVCTECRSPGQGPMRKRNGVTPVPRDIGEGAVVEKRQGGDEPAPGVFCGGFRFAYEAGGCRGAADEIEGRGGNVALPFREGFSSCQVAAEQKYPDLEMPVSQLATIIRRGVDLCENQGYIGKISDVSNSVVDVFFGNLCGEFGFGYGGCTP